VRGHDVEPPWGRCRGRGGAERVGGSAAAAAQSRQIPHDALQRFPRRDAAYDAMTTTTAAVATDDVATTTCRISVAVQHLKAQRRHAVVRFACHDERVRRRRGGGGGSRPCVVVVVGREGGGSGGVAASTPLFFRNWQRCAQCKPAANARVVGQDRQGDGDLIAPARQVEEDGRRRRRARGSDATRRLQFRGTMTERELRLFQPYLEE
jgi:hypothetical protein